MKPAPPARVFRFMDQLSTAPSSSYPARVPLGRRPLGIIGSALTARRNVLELIPEIATRQPMVSGRTGKRWHMVMDPGALRSNLGMDTEVSEGMIAFQLSIAFPLARCSAGSSSPRARRSSSTP